MQLLAGALLERPPGPKYTSELGFAELTLTGQLPKAQTLTKWRAGLPESFRVALRIPRSCWHTSAGALREGGELDVGLAWRRGADLSPAADAFTQRLQTLQG